jgi:hypothetical protein
MGYYIRVLSKNNPTIPVSILNDALKSDNLNASAEVEDGTDEDWTQLVVRNNEGTDLFLIEKNVVVKSEHGKDEIDEFTKEITDCQPASAVRWLTDYFSQVKVIYALQILSTVDDDNSWGIVGGLKSKLWSETQGILQADNEGFSNEDGYHILWQFSDGVSGPWYMAVMKSAGNWVNFKMDLGSKQQRQEFFDGNVPKDAELV